jgi:ABC-2 type transport system ATP-binding protein
LRDIYRVPADRYRALREELTERLSLASLLDTPVRQLSLGQRMRCDLAASLLHEPPLLFLDEPTIGLDAHSKLAVREFVGRLNRERGVTVILTTHDMHDIEALAQRVIVIGGGRILADGTFDELRAGVLAERRLFVDFEGEAPALDLPDVRVVNRDGRQLELAFDPRRIAAPALIARIVAAHPVDDIHVEEPLIEEVIARFYDLHGAGEG